MPNIAYQTRVVRAAREWEEAHRLYVGMFETADDAGLVLAAERRLNRAEDALRAALQSGNRGRRRVNPERDAAIVAAVRGGQRAIDVAREHGVSHERVRQILVREGAPTRQPATRRERACEVCGAAFLPHYTGAGRFCSRACANTRKALPIVDGKRPCRMCGALVAVEDFPVNSRSGALRPYCRPCNNQRARNDRKRRLAEAQP